MNGPTTPNLSRFTRSAGTYDWPSAGSRISNMPDPEEPTSVNRSASSWSSVGLLDPNSAHAGKVRMEIAVATVRKIKGLRTISPPQSMRLDDQGAGFVEDAKMPDRV